MALDPLQLRLLEDEEETVDSISLPDGMRLLEDPEQQRNPYGLSLLDQPEEPQYKLLRPEDQPNIPEIEAPPQSYSPEAAKVRERSMPQASTLGSDMRQMLYHAATRTPIPAAAFSRKVDNETDLLKKALAHKVSEKDDLEKRITLAKIVRAKDPKLAEEIGFDALLNLTDKTAGNLLTYRGGENRLDQAKTEHEDKKLQTAAKLEWDKEKTKVNQDLARSSLNLQADLRTRGMAERAGQYQASKIYEYSTKALADESPVHAGLQNLFKETGLLPGDFNKPEVAAEFSNLMSAANRMSWGIGNPIYDRLAGSTERQQRFQQAYLKLRNIVVAAVAGKAMTDKELEMQLQEWANRAFDKPEMAMANIEMLRNIMAQRIAGKEAGLRMAVAPDTINTWQRLGGVTTMHALYRDLVPEEIMRAQSELAQATPSGMVPTVPDALRTEQGFVDQRKQIAGVPMAPEAPAEEMPEEQLAAEVGPEAAAQLANGVPTTVAVREPRSIPPPAPPRAPKPPQPKPAPAPVAPQPAVPAGYSKVYSASAKKTYLRDAKGDFLRGPDGKLIFEPGDTTRGQ